MSQHIRYPLCAMSLVVRSGPIDYLVLSSLCFRRRCLCINCLYFHWAYVHVLVTGLMVSIALPTVARAYRSQFVRTFHFKLWNEARLSDRRRQRISIWGAASFRLAARPTGFWPIYHNPRSGEACDSVTLHLINQNSNLHRDLTRSKWYQIRLPESCSGGIRAGNGKRKHRVWTLGAWSA